MAEVKPEQFKKDIADGLNQIKKDIHKKTEPDLGEQWGNVLSNTKDAASKYVTDKSPVVGQHIKDNSSIYGGVAAGLGAYALARYLRKRKEGV